MNLITPVRYKIEMGWLWTKYTSNETWRKTQYLYGETKFLPINQRFGENMTTFYASLGLKGHNGTDWYATNFTCIYAPYDGVVSQTVDLDSLDPNSPTAGRIDLKFTADGNDYRWIAYHLSDSFVKVNDVVRANQLIGLTGNTGKYTTGSHLHTALYQLDKSGNIINLNNGYGGAVDDFPFYDEPNAIKTDELQRIFEYTKATGSQFDFYTGWGGSDRWAMVLTKLGISGVTRSQYYNYLVKRLFNA